jgi:uncharacterized membrane protein
VETPWGQVIDAVIGVEIAISLIPPASVVGIGLALGQPIVSQNAFLLLVINVLGLDIVGSMLMLALRGVRGRYLVLEKAIHQAVEFAVTAEPDVSPLASTIDVTLLSDTAADVHVTVRSLDGSAAPSDLAQAIAMAIQQRTGCLSEVTVELIPFQSYSTF